MTATDSFSANAVLTSQSRFEPAPDGIPGSICWLRRSDAPSIHAGIWRVLDGEWDDENNEYEFGSDESLIVLEGSVIIELADGTRYHLGVGDAAGFTQGTRSTWQVTTPFRKFFVENTRQTAGSPPTAR
jgi:uncharacterized cupin superfamily protein